MIKLKNQKQLFEDVFAVEHIHSDKNKLIIHTDVFEEGLVVQKISKDCTVLFLNGHDYGSTNDVSDGSVQIIFFPISEKELNKRFKILANVISSKEKLCGTNKEKI